ncbi:hypothetical protein NVT87_03385 [Acinetobacter radioresistens]|jgi:hypothetical protein|uniref:hypothetical protein n=1 Tax=Acinetobacter TaxID=469 RepID=UPI000277C22D|nr:MULTISPECIES: hypothetical protein [Acinetobacter]EJO35317.1 hypothetical protein ACINWCA157_0905 [Acinetobacter radioresistens WC-A-157]EXE14433.1 hypothetical protein J559_1505 [Acinetobacter sp. 983759]EXF57692.1 hypothetical protein J502_1210 [Acinetobacter sp. 1294596]MCK4080874.1 hypothetical protein [Acinetobacter radioresistens]MCX0329941.1 hypothetical protein [Acinetobacter radioresistens]
MSRNLRIAKNIYLSVSKEKGFSFDPLGDLNALLLKLLEKDKKLLIKLPISYEDLSKMELISSNSSGKTDFSCIPDRLDSQEFVIWLAKLIEVIKSSPLDQNLKSKKKYDHAEAILNHFSPGNKVK